MTIPTQPSNPSIHQPRPLPFQFPGHSPSHKQSPNRAGIRMPRAARPDAVAGSNCLHPATQNVPVKTERRGS